MKKIILLLLLFTGFNAYSQKFGYKVGVVTPIPFFIETPYIVHPSSALIQVNYKLSDKFKINATTGYLRFRPNNPEYDLVSTIPLLIGSSYNISNTFYIGMGLGPSYINETEGILDNTIKLLYSPYIGWKANKWSVDLIYFNWEEVPDELNSLTICVSYNF